MTSEQWGCNKFNDEVVCFGNHVFLLNVNICREKNFVGKLDDGMQFTAIKSHAIHLIYLIYFISFEIMVLYMTVKH